MSVHDSRSSGANGTIARPLATGLAAVVALVIWCLPAAVASASSLHAARDASAFVDSIGVNTHTLYTGTPYYDRFSEVKQRLLELGVHHIREDLDPERPDQFELLNELAASGIKSTLILGDPRNGAAGLEERIGAVKDHLMGAVEAIEGPNEYSTRGGVNWRNDLIAYEQELYSAIKGDPALASLPVIGPSIVHGDQAALGDISSIVDFGNMHSYPNGAMPEAKLSSQLAKAALNSGSKPVMATETGYNTAVNSHSELQPASEAAMATYLPRLFLDYFSRGVARTYSYELLDEFPNPGRDEPEAHFGLLHEDLTPKPAFNALRNLINILSDPGPEFSPDGLDYTIGGDKTGLHQLLLQKSDGSYYIALWRAEDVWDQASRQDLNPPSSPVSLTFEQAPRGVEQYMPNLSANPIGFPRPQKRRLTVSVGAQVVILKLSVPQQRAERIHLWVSRRSVSPGARVTVRVVVPKPSTPGSRRVSVQRWQRKARRWRTVGRGRVWANGVLRRRIQIPAERSGRVSKLRGVAQHARPSHPVLIRVGAPRTSHTSRIALTGARALGSAAASPAGPAGRSR